MVLIILVCGFGACGGSESDALGLAAQCGGEHVCRQDVDPPLECLSDFKGGYCGLSGCKGNTDCPDDAICIEHTDKVNYCFRTCVDKIECNENRSEESEANCSSNVTRVEGGNEKVCVPPSG